MLCASTACCSNLADDAQASFSDEATLITDDSLMLKQKQGSEYIIHLEKTAGVNLGLDVDTMADQGVLPIRELTGGLVETWNRNNPDKQVLKGDKIIEINGAGWRIFN